MKAFCSTLISIAPLSALTLLAGCDNAAPAPPLSDATTSVAENLPASASQRAAPPPSMGDPANNPDMSKLAAEVDSNGDGHMSAAEWNAKGLPESSFKAFENGRGYVTLKDYQENAAPPGIDLNGDGKVTVVEFKEFDKQMAEQMKGKGPPPPP